MEIILTLTVGALAGWLGFAIFKRDRLGPFGNVIIGILGGFTGYWILDDLNNSLYGGLISTMLTSALGAMVIVTLVNLAVKR